MNRFPAPSPLQTNVLEALTCDGKPRREAIRVTHGSLTIGL
jgi:hypothetical protein